MTSNNFSSYIALRPARSRFVEIRRLRYHVREWGAGDAEPLVLLHGARDTSLSFQFIVDALQKDWRVVAPDWRGHGQSSWTFGNYWVSDFVCDLEALLIELFDRRPISLVGHSMGGNIAGAYAGLRPNRIARLVMLDALGNPFDRSPAQMPDILTALIEREASAPAKGRTFRSVAGMAAQLMRANRRLSAGNAAFLAAGNALTEPDGTFRWPHDPVLRQSWPTLHSTEEWGELWRRIACPVLCLLSSDHRPNAPTSDPAERERRAGYFGDITLQVVPDTGHNLHHDAPEAVAHAIEAFVSRPS